MTTEHTCTQHPEPAETCYCQHQCRCDGCRRERLRAQKRRKHQGGATVPAGPTRTHLAQLLAGSTLTEVAKATGLSRGTLLRILEGDVTRVNRTTERAILTTRIDTPTVSIIGTRRRLDALRAIGWTLKEISEHAGHDHGWACTVYKRARILPATHAQVCAVYDALWNVTPPAETWSDRVSRGRAQRAAAQAGWAPPLAWDDNEIDNPDAQPHHHVRGAGHARLIENVEWLADADEKLPAIAARLGQPERSLKRQLLRAGLADLIRRTTPEINETHGHKQHTKGRAA